MVDPEVLEIYRGVSDRTIALVENNQEETTGTPSSERQKMSI